MSIITVLRDPKTGKFLYRFRGGEIKDISHLLRFRFFYQYIINLMRISLTVTKRQDILLASQKM